MREQSGESQAPDQDKWNRNPWVWFLICVPLSAVVFGVVMFVSANYAPDDLVVDNYYKAGMGINRRLRLDDNARLLGARVQLDGITPEGVVFRIKEGSDRLQLSLFHVSDRSLDLDVVMESMSDGVYVVSSHRLAEALQEPGVWYLEIRDQDRAWRLRQRINTPVVDLVMAAQ
ncbi:MAG: FixH family protein [Gammaproteobacteria bacterium]|jgi:uncharacterized protein|nr:FixH family protein [Gammaproteobacteria bacterium]MBT4491900.1 FixH family protein [Gammaproteobacteria bacterium]MBT7370494.1 FixH family protein [Gammaproteobacteria bacterium]